MKKIITNNAKFEKITGDIRRFSLSTQDKINNFLLKLKNEGHLAQNLYEKLRATGSGPGILYGLPKVHKSNFMDDKLYRPIFAAYKSANYNLSKYLVSILSPISENQYTIKNSADFRMQIESFRKNDMFLASFDIKDLYTNIPLNETIEICLNLINSNLFNIPREMFKKLLQLSVFNNIFKFDNEYYVQNDGLGMGLPLSPTLANVFLAYHETQWLQHCPSEFKPLFYRRYMDDTFAIFSTADQAEKFGIYLNQRHPNMMFTTEKEADGQLPFLDCLVNRVNGQLTTSVFRKQTFTGLGLSFFSVTPFNYKINSIKTLLHRARSICSTFTSLNKELSYLVEYFYNNGYSKHLVYREIKKFIAKVQNPPPLVLTAAKRKIFVPFPYHGAQADKMKDEIMELIGKIFPQIDFYLAFSNRSTIGSLFQYKEKLPLMLQSSLIYKFSCARCAYGTYVGSTAHNLYMRIAEHRGRHFRTGNLDKNPKVSLGNMQSSAEVGYRRKTFQFWGMKNLKII